MIERYGIIFIDEFEFILRIYEVTDKEWTLLYYFTKNFTGLPPAALTNTVSTTIAAIFSDSYTQHIAEWKLFARSAPNNLTHEIASLTGCTVEYLTLQREQELLCKGMFTELW